MTRSCKSCSFSTPYEPARDLFYTGHKWEGKELFECHQARTRVLFSEKDVCPLHRYPGEPKWTNPLLPEQRKLCQRMLDRYAEACENRAALKATLVASWPQLILARLNSRRLWQACKDTLLSQASSQDEKDRWLELFRKNHTGIANAVSFFQTQVHCFPSLRETFDQVLSEVKWIGDPAHDLDDHYPFEDES